MEWYVWALAVGVPLVPIAASLVVLGLTRNTDPDRRNPDEKATP